MFSPAVPKGESAPTSAPCSPLGRHEVLRVALFLPNTMIIEGTWQVEGALDGRAQDDWTALMFEGLVTVRKPSDAPRTEGPPPPSSVTDGLCTVVQVEDDHHARGFSLLRSAWGHHARCTKRSLALLEAPCLNSTSAVSASSARPLVPIVLQLDIADYRYQESQPHRAILRCALTPHERRLHEFLRYALAWTTPEAMWGATSDMSCRRQRRTTHMDASGAMRKRQREEEFDGGGHHHRQGAWSSDSDADGSDEDSSGSGKVLRYTRVTSDDVLTLVTSHTFRDDAFLDEASRELLATLPGELDRLEEQGHFERDLGWSEFADSSGNRVRFVYDEARIALYTKFIRDGREDDPWHPEWYPLPPAELGYTPLPPPDAEGWVLQWAEEEEGGRKRRDVIMEEWIVRNINESGFTLVDSFTRNPLRASTTREHHPE